MLAAHMMHLAVVHNAIFASSPPISFACCRITVTYQDDKDSTVQVPTCSTHPAAETSIHRLECALVPPMLLPHIRSCS